MRKNKLKQKLFILFGLISMTLAYIGVLLPGIPGIPFILLTAFFFVRSSDKLYSKLLKNKILGKILLRASERGKFSLGFRLFVASQLWVSVAVAEYFLLTNIWFQIFVALAAVPVTVLILRMRPQIQCSAKDSLN